MKKYEYKVELIVCSGEGMERKLNEFGQHGWKLIEIIPGYTYPDILFIREIEEENEVN